MSFGFGIKEGFKGIFKARLAMTISISSLTFSILLIGIFIVLGINLHNWIKIIKEKIEIELFIEMGTTESEIEALQTQIKKIKGIKNTQFISREMAAERYEKDTGENVFDVLEFNPFPASFVITIEDNYLNLNEVNRIKSKLEMLPHVDEVLYKKPLIETIDKYVTILSLFSLLIGGLITVITIVLIFNTIRLTIYARKDMIHIMRLVGATEGFIKRPFLVEGIIQGFIGACLASLIIFYGIKLIRIYIYPYLLTNPLIFPGLVIFGMTIGFISAYFSVSKYLKIV
jgi:cell division transport system permease protein